MACVHDPQSGRKGYIDADGVIEQRSTRTARGPISCRGDDNRSMNMQDSIVVSLEHAAFCSKIDHVCDFGPCMRGNGAQRAKSRDVRQPSWA